VEKQYTRHIHQAVLAFDSLERISGRGNLMLEKVMEISIFSVKSAFPYTKQLIMGL
jgi:hypothetical protein